MPLGRLTRTSFLKMQVKPHAVAPRESTRGGLTVHSGLLALAAQFAHCAARRCSIIRVGTQQPRNLGTKHRSVTQEPVTGKSECGGSPCRRAAQSASRNPKAVFQVPGTGAGRRARRSGSSSSPLGPRRACTCGCTGSRARPAREVQGRVRAVSKQEGTPRLSAPLLWCARGTTRRSTRQRTRCRRSAAAGPSCLP